MLTSATVQRQWLTTIVPQLIDISFGGHRGACTSKDRSIESHRFGRGKVHHHGDDVCGSRWSSRLVIARNRTNENRTDQ